MLDGFCLFWFVFHLGLGFPNWVQLEMSVSCFFHFWMWVFIRLFFWSICDLIKFLCRFFFHLLRAEGKAFRIFFYSCKISSSGSNPGVKLDLFPSWTMCTNCGMRTAACLKKVCAGWPSRGARGVPFTSAVQGRAARCCLWQQYPSKQSWATPAEELWKSSEKPPCLTRNSFPVKWSCILIFQVFSQHRVSPASLTNHVVEHFHMR